MELTKYVTSIIFSEIDLLKDHYFGAHIKTKRSSFNTTCFYTNSEITIKRRKLEEKESKMDIDKRLSELTEEDMKKFN